jgi:hypothetical protein
MDRRRVLPRRGPDRTGAGRTVRVRARTVRSRPPGLTRCALLECYPRLAIGASVPNFSDQLVRRNEMLNAAACFAT